jgi:hypothetical protein
MIPTCYFNPRGDAAIEVNEERMRSMLAPPFKPGGELSLC